MNKYKKNLKKPQGVIRSRKSKNQTIQWSKEKRRQIMVYKTPHQKLMIEQHEPTKNRV